MIEDIIEEVLRTHKVDRAEGWLYDADHYFADEPDWKKAKCSFSDDPKCRLEMKAILGRNFDSLHQLSMRMHEIWTKLAWSYWETSSMTFYKEAVVLRFATVNSAGSGCLTGRMIVGGSKYHLLRAPYEQRQPKAFRLEDAAPAFDFSDIDEEYVFPGDEERVAEWEQERREQDRAALARIVNSLLTPRGTESILIR